LDLLFSYLLLLYQYFCNIERRKENMKNKKLFVLSLFGVLALTSCGGGGGSTSSGGSGSSGSQTSGSELRLAGGEEGEIINYSASSYAERAKILEQLEKYTLDNFLGGIPMYDSASNVMYSTRLQIPSDTYIPNYGFGVGQGTITTALTSAQEPETKYAMYFHSWQSQDPGSLNYWNASDSVTADLNALITSAYYGTEFTEDKSSYQWYDSLATEKPIALNPDANGMATKWRVKVKTVTDAPTLVYNTLSTAPDRAAYDGRGVVLADYLTPFKAILDNQLYRSTDLGSSSSGFVGAAQYSADVAAGKSPNWNSVGIQLNETEQSIDFEFVTKKTQFYAMYNLSSSLFSPIPQSFLDLIGGAANFGLQSGGVNNVLSLGMYTLEEWQADKQLAFKKNPVFFEKDRANFAGYKYTILGSATVAFDEFLAGKLDSAGIPSTALDQYKSDPRTRRTLGDTVWKLQTNTTTEAGWESLFGKTGSVYPHSEDSYWDVKPVMSNKDFLNGLYFSINRSELAAEEGKNPAAAFLSDAYMIDPEEGISFRSSDEGKAVLEDRLPESNGYDTEIAKGLFQRAMTTLEAEGKYTPGTPTSPTPITLELIYQSQSQVDTEGITIKKYFEETFNAACPNYKLTIHTYATSNWMDAYYAAMQGDFDLSFGSISGNTLDPISFMDTVCSDNRSGFTLSWGPDTGAVNMDSPIVYDEQIFSYDALLGAANGGAVIKNGEAANMFKLTNIEAGEAVDGKFTATGHGTYFYNAEYASRIQVEIVAVEIWYYSAPLPEGVSEDGFVAPELGVNLTINMNTDGTFEVIVTDLPLDAGGAYDMTLYFTITVDGVSTSSSTYVTFQGPAAA
jgi:ABC-type oligopeptide transport system substrate-binding subunit